ncbi:MAG TPA: PIG-L deacetylase family protein [Candidatus Limnocylindria bacterium]|nr:PIG-L deacetylase family protein [Candidatus Limnocylindria bacterium]HEV8468954.1 PIG-L deacetylase family protein [Candidatus Limnocylindria bacterium]
MKDSFVLATILAHPDDETFGVGGTLIRYADEGALVHSLCLTQGEKGWNGDPETPVVPREQLGAKRAAELAEAGRRMGVTTTTCLTYPDGELAGVAEERVVRDIVRWVRQVRPDVAITWGPDGGYGHPDHIAAGERARVALELAAIERHDVGLGPPHRVRRCYRFVQAADFIDGLKTINPQFVDYMETLAVKPQRWTRDRLGAAIDISAVADRKIEAMKAHETQEPDYRAWIGARERIPWLFAEEVFIRQYPDPGGPPLETDLFAQLRSN